MSDYTVPVFTRAQVQATRDRDHTEDCPTPTSTEQEHTRS